MPADDDAALYLLHLIVQQYGWTWMDRYMANKPHFIQGHLPVARAIAEGKMAATFDATITTTGALERQGAPIEIAFSAEDETPVFTVTGGIFKDAPHPNAARLFFTWYLAREQQSRLGTFSPRLDGPRKVRTLLTRLPPCDVHGGAQRSCRPAQTGPSCPPPCGGGHGGVITG